MSISFCQICIKFYIVVQTKRCYASIFGFMHKFYCSIDSIKHSIVSSIDCLIEYRIYTNSTDY